MAEKPQAGDLCVAVRCGDTGANAERSLRSLTWCRDVVLITERGGEAPSESLRRDGITHLTGGQGEPGHAVLESILDQRPTQWLAVLDAGEWLPVDAQPLLTARLAHLSARIVACACSVTSRLRGQPIPGPAGTQQMVRLVRRAGLSLLDLEPGEIPESEAVSVPEDSTALIHRDFDSLESLVLHRVRRIARRRRPRREEGRSFHDGIRRAYEAYAGCHSAESADLDHAFGTLAAWECIVEDLLEWDREGQSRSLAERFTLPVATVTRDVAPLAIVKRLMGELEQFHARVAQAEQNMIQAQTALAVQSDERDRARDECRQLRRELEAMRATWTWRCAEAIKRAVPGLQSFFDRRARSSQEPPG